MRLLRGENVRVSVFVVVRTETGLTMTAVEKRQFKSNRERLRAKAKTYAFWQGVAEGFGGPALMGCDLKVLSPSSLRAQTISPANSALVSRTVAHAITRASKHIMEKRGLTSFLIREKRLDSSGKMMDIDVVIVKPRQSVHGESQE